MQVTRKQMLWGVGVSFVVGMSGGVALYSVASRPVPAVAVPTQESLPAGRETGPPQDLNALLSPGPSDSNRVDQPRATRRAEAPPSFSALSTLQQEVAQLHQQVTALQREVQAHRASASQAAVPPTLASVDEPATREAQRREDERLRQAHLEQVEQAFQHEAVHAKWAQTMAGTVETALGQDALVQTALQSVECRAQTCRVELVEDEEGEVAKTLPLMLHQLGETFPQVVADQVTYLDGSTGMILYFSGEEAPGTSPVK